LRVAPKLTVLIEGESLLNDAISIVIFRVFSTLATIEAEGRLTMGWGEIFGLSIAKFAVTSGFAIILGIFFALLTTFITKLTNRVYVFEALIILAMAYLTFIMCEIILASGILGVFIAGMIMSHYVEANLHHHSSTTTRYLIKMISFTAELVIFFALGISVAYLFMEDLVKLGYFFYIWDVPFILLTLALLFPIRFSIVFTICILLNYFRASVEKIDYASQLIMGYSGLRGAIAFALAILLSPSIRAQGVFFTTTLIVILFTIFIQGIVHFFLLLHVSLF